MILMPQSKPSHGLFARGSLSKRPSFWKSATGLWIPSLGVTGTTLRDVSGRSNHGTFTGGMDITDWKASTYPRQEGYVLNYNGTSDYNIVANESDFDISDQMTIIGWILPTDIVGFRTIVAKRDGATYSFHFRLRNTGKLSFLPTAGGEVQSTVVVAQDTLARVGVTFNNGLVILFKNGREVASGTGRTITNNDLNLTIGSTGTPGNYFEGLQGDIGFWKRAFTPSEIAQDYRDSMAMFGFPDKWIGRAPAVGGVTVTPSAQSLTLTPETPAIVIDTTVTPSEQMLTLSQPAPAIDITGDVTVTPLSQTLTLTPETLAIVGDIILTPSVQSLTLTLESPTISIVAGEAFIAPELSLSLSQPVPTIITDVTITPDTQVLSLTQEVPVISAVVDITVTPSAQTLALSQETLSVITGIEVFPDALPLGLSLHAPAIPIDVVVAISDSLSLSITAVAVTITTGITPPVSIRKEIVAAIIAQLKTITIINGYNTEVGASVRDWQTTNIPIVDLPMIEVNDTGEVSEIKGQYHYNILTIELTGKIVTANIDNARNFQKDIIVAMVERPVFPLNVYHFLPADKPELLPEKANKQAVSITLSYEIKYREKLL